MSTKEGNRESVHHGCISKELLKTSKSIRAAVSRLFSAVEGKGCSVVTCTTERQNLVWGECQTIWNSTLGAFFSMVVVQPHFTAFPERAVDMTKYVLTSAPHPTFRKECKRAGVICYSFCNSHFHTLMNITPFHALFPSQSVAKMAVDSINVIELFNPKHDNKWYFVVTATGLLHDVWGHS